MQEKSATNNSIRTSTELRMRRINSVCRQVLCSRISPVLPDFKGIINLQVALVIIINKLQTEEKKKTA